MDTPQDPAAHPAPEPKPKRSPVRLIVSIVVPLVAVGAGVYFYLNSAGNAKIGDCLADGADANSPMRKVDCGAQADYRVVGRVEGKTRDEANESKLCQSFPATEVVYWEGGSGSTGNVLCLEPYRP
ncbi:LppU/SCO3897 family protein [Allokutzneria oryzae]|uniref:Septum formation-related domain-containing protein n=1 Tax=Allokutzneria oryzae TaxID=1378989 RepID=A0ABV6A4I4_9PSEU